MFTIDRWVYNKGEVELFYSTDREEFVERWEFPEPVFPEAMQRFIPLLHLVAGVSYWKTTADPTIKVNYPITESEFQLIQSVYDHGMREFAVRNNMPVPVNLAWDVDLKESVVFKLTGDKILLPYGGGKDSTLSASLLPEASLFCINPTSHHRNAAEKLGKKLIEVYRKINTEPLTRDGAFNGHVPITAIVSAGSIAYAAGNGYGTVVMSNEAATSEPTGYVNGNPVNHQWSKSDVAEKLIANASQIKYHSLLREMSETEITRRLPVKMLPHIVSCNKAFKGSTVGDAESGLKWCGSCPKCLFTFLVLASEHPKQVILDMFGQNPLENIEDKAWEALWDEMKPWECVGERSEAILAVQKLATTDWACERLERLVEATNSISTPINV